MVRVYVFHPIHLSAYLLVPSVACMGRDASTRREGSRPLLSRPEGGGPNHGGDNVRLHGHQLGVVVDRHG